MREILFRGKALESYKNLPFAKNGWVYGYYVEAVQGVWHVVDEKGKDITEYSPAIFVNYSFKQFGGDSGANLEGWIFVQPETVGQYTGIDDANGNKIFEGDIVRLLYDGDYITTAGNGVIEYLPGGFEAYYKKDAIKSSYNFEENRYQHEIVGNTTDNPELL
jgi:hypothetical protein